MNQHDHSYRPSGPRRSIRDPLSGGVAARRAPATFISAFQADGERYPALSLCAERNVSGLENTLAMFIPLRTADNVTLRVANAAPSWM